MKFHLLKLENSALEYWPVVVKSKDILMLLIILFTMGFISSYIPARVLVRRILKN